MSAGRANMIAVRSTDPIAAAEGVGMKVLGVYYTQGPYDMVVISEAPDEKVANAFALAVPVLRS